MRKNKLGCVVFFMTITTGLAMGGVAYLWLPIINPPQTRLTFFEETPSQWPTAHLPPQWTPTATISPTATPTVVPTEQVTLIEDEKALEALKKEIGKITGPRLQLMTTESVLIVWETERPSQGEVFFGLTDQYQWMVTDDTLDTQHQVVLEELQPYTLYHYRLASESLPLTEDLTFRTAAQPGQTSFNFVVFGDTQRNPSIHRAVVDRALALTPDFALHVGDLVSDGREKAIWYDFFEIERDLLSRVPLYPTLGNHEREHQYYFNYFFLPGNERWYSFEYGTALFICLQVDGFSKIDKQSEQYQWLEQRLASNTQPWLFVFFHKSPYTSQYEGPNEQYIRDKLTPLFERYGVQVVFSGHNHNYQRSHANGIVYIVTGGGGGDLSDSIEPDKYLVNFRVVHHLLYITVDGKELLGVAMTPDGGIFDQFSLTLP